VAPRAADEPGILDRRYEYFTLDEDRRSTLYLVRKHLYYSADEWQALPWWQQKMYIDQLAMDLAAERGEEPPEPTGFAERYDPGPEPETTQDPDAYLRSLGFNL
jgi:hypothetical protein